jgi:hypothetical protein
MCQHDSIVTLAVFAMNKECPNGRMNASQKLHKAIQAFTVDQRIICRQRDPAPLLLPVGLFEQRRQKDVPFSSPVLEFLNILWGLGTE